MHVPTTLRPRDANGALPETADREADASGSAVIRTTQIIELILKDRKALHLLLLCATRQKVELATRLLGISLACFAFYGAAMALTCDAAALWPSVTPMAKWLASPSAELVTYSETSGSARLIQSWLSGRAERFVIAYAFGLIAASGVCLPSLYFYGLLSGLRMSVTDVVLQALKAKAVAAVALVGILPIYATLALATVIFPVAPDVVRSTLQLGLVLPFLAGLWGTRSLYVGFAERCEFMPEEFQKNRACLLRRLVLAWCACYTAVAPVMIVTVWQNLGG